MRLQELAPAKLSLFLGVHPLTQSTPAAAKHQVDAVFCELDLCDELVLESSFEGRGEVSKKSFDAALFSNARRLEDRAGLTADPPCRDDLQAAHFTQPQLELEIDYAEGVAPLESAIEDNLVYRALQGFCRSIPEAVCLSGASLRLKLAKRIPAEAGLGGGSADAGAMLRLLCRLCGLALTDPRLQEVAASLGSDVPFCLNGGCGRYGRFNDRLLQELPVPALDLAIVKPSYGVSTAALYHAFDRLCPPPDNPDELADAIASGQPPAALAPAMRNNLLAVIEAEQPGLYRLARVLGEEPGVLHVVLAGSGSGLIAVCEGAAASSALARRYAGQGYFAYAGRTGR